MTWYSEDVFQPGRANASLRLVRRYHSAVLRDPRPTAGVVKDEREAYEVTQTDMVATQWAFCGLVVTRWRELGVQESSLAKLDDFLHFWRTIGYLIGVEDRFNIC